MKTWLWIQLSFVSLYLGLGIAIYAWVRYFASHDASTLSSVFLVVSLSVGIVGILCAALLCGRCVSGYSEFHKEVGLVLLGTLGAALVAYGWGLADVHGHAAKVVDEYRANVSAITKDYMAAGTECYDATHERYAEFTTANCTACHTGNSYTTISTFVPDVYQVSMVPVELEVCYKSIFGPCQFGFYAWQKISVNLTRNDTTSVWPCGGARGYPVLTSPDVILYYYAACFDLWAPIVTTVQVDAERSCTQISGTAARILPIDALCYWDREGSSFERHNPDRRIAWAYDMLPCASPALLQYMVNYTALLQDLVQANNSLVRPKKGVFAAAKHTGTGWLVAGSVWVVLWLLALGHTAYVRRTVRKNDYEVSFFSHLLDG